MGIEPWAWDPSAGPARVRSELNEKGWTFFHADRAPAAIDQPVEFCRDYLELPLLRFQTLDIAFNPNIQRTTYPHSMGRALLHTDCPYVGLPPHLQIMVCVQQASSGGGETTLVDVWELARRIREREPELFEALFEEVRHFRFGHAHHLGATLSLRLGNLVCIHPTAPTPGDAIGARFQAWLDETEPVRFLAKPGDVYINNNHRCVHGREAFDDPTRLFKRVLAWARSPVFPAPADFMERAKARATRLAEELGGSPRWVRESLGGVAPPSDDVPYARLAEILQSLAEPTNVRSLGVGPQADAFTYWQDAVLAAAIEVLSGEMPSAEQRERSLLELKRRRSPAE